MITDEVIKVPIAEFTIRLGLSDCGEVITGTDISGEFSYVEGLGMVEVLRNDVELYFQEKADGDVDM